MLVLPDGGRGKEEAASLSPMTLVFSLQKEFNTLGRIYLGINPFILMQLFRHEQCQLFVF